MSANRAAIWESHRLSRQFVWQLAAMLAAAMAALAIIAGQDEPTEARAGQSDARPPEKKPPANDAPPTDALPTDAPPAGKAKLHRLLDESAGRYELYAGDDRAEPLKLKCVLRWANLTRGSVDGATYIWTKNGRPLATVCVYPWMGLLCDNFQSLAEGTIVASADGGEVWRCQKPGVTYRAVPGAARPEGTAAARLRQLKSLAAKFRTTLVGWNAGDSDREELRMLPRPVYQNESGGIVDIAIFAFVQGTDPEAFLLLEARPNAADADQRPEWQFAMARRTSGRLETRYATDVVWKAEKLSDYGDPRQPHFQKTRPLPADVEEGAK